MANKSQSTLLLPIIDTNTHNRTKVAITVGVLALHVAAIVGLSNMPPMPLKKPAPPKPIEIQFINEVAELPAKAEPTKIIPEIEIEPTTQPMPKAEFQPIDKPIDKPKAQPQNEPKIEPKPIIEPKPEPKSEAKIEPKPTAEPEPSKPKVTESKPISEPKPEPKVEPIVEPQPKIITTQPIQNQPSAWEIQQELQREADERARLQREADERARLQREADEKSRLQREADEKARLQREADEKARLQREADERARLQREADERARLQREADERARLQREADERARLQREADEKARLQREAASQKPVALSQDQAKWKNKPRLDVPKSITRNLTKGETLTALLNISINEKGRITDVNLAQSSGNSDFDRLVQKQIRTGRLHPYIQNNVPVKSTATVPLVYTEE